MMKRLWFVTLVFAGGCLLETGCTQALMDEVMGSSVANDRAMAREQFAALDAHDVNVTEQHKAMSSEEVASEIDVLRTEFAAELEVVKARAEAIKSEALMHLTAGAKEMAVRFAGMPEGLPIWNVIEGAVSGQPGAFDDLGMKDLFAALGIGGLGFGATRLGKSRGAGAVDLLGARLTAMEGGRPTPIPLVPGSGTKPT